jgi:hypothetical protein
VDEQLSARRPIDSLFDTDIKGVKPAAELARTCTTTDPLLRFVVSRIVLRADVFKASGQRVTCVTAHWISPGGNGKYCLAER